MADYVLVHDRAAFDAARQALARAWAARAFAPLRGHAAAWSAAAREYSRRYHVPPSDLLLAEFEAGMRFGRDAWRLLVAEVLLVTAAEMPELPDLTPVAALLAPGRAADVSRREAMAEVHQALHGSRDVRFGAAVYRPGHAGLNDAEDVGRLAAWLGGVRPEAWTACGVAGADEADRKEELAFAREWFGELREVYRRAAERGRVVVLETIY